MTTQIGAVPRATARPFSVVVAGGHRRLPLRRQFALQGVCLFIALTVLFPVV